MSKSYWIWYPGDFELYHGMKQNFSRVERGFRLAGFLEKRRLPQPRGFSPYLSFGKKKLPLLYIPMQSGMYWQEKRNTHLEKRSPADREKLQSLFTQDVLRLFHVFM